MLMLLGAFTLGLVVFASPRAAGAQHAGKIYRIGYLGNAFNPPLDEVFQQNLREHGWVEGQNIIFERRYSEGRSEHFPTLAAELVRLKPDVIITTGTPATAAAKQATTTIPILFALVGDPVGSGFVTSLARPGGNLTGLGATGVGIHSKMVDSTFSLHRRVSQPEVEAAARSLGLAVRHVEVRTPEDLGGAFATITHEKLDALVVLGQPLMFVQRAQVAKLALEHRVPTAMYWREAVVAGALMSYGERNIDYMRRLPYYVDRILRGVKPADLPVEQPTRFYLTINAKTAKALGLTIPPPVLLRADEVIE